MARIAAQLKRKVTYRHNDVTRSRRAGELEARQLCKKLALAGR